MYEEDKTLIPIAHVNEFADGEMKDFDINGEEILICRVNDSFHAVSNICSHEYIELCDGELDGYLVTCPLHFSQFDVRTGAPQEPPAKEPIEVYKLSVIDEQIYIQQKD